MNYIRIILFSFVIVLFTANVAKADVGIGVSPSKLVIEVEGGTVKQESLLAFNPGDGAIEVSIGVEGEIAEFIKVSPEKLVLEPEPKPHARPIKNGENFLITISPKATNKEKRYSGTITISGGAVPGSQLGGNVGVGIAIEIRVTPTVSIFDYITRTHMLIAGAAVFVILIFFILKGAGLTVSFKRKDL